MNQNTSIAALLFIGLLFLSTSNFAQITSATIKGVVTDEAQIESLPGANILAVHTPTGTQYGISTQIDGNYTLPNLRTGGPYTIIISFIGYQTDTTSNVFLELGVATLLDFQLKSDEQLLEEIKVVYSKNDLFEGNQKGSATNIGKDKIERLPSLNRSLQDMTRLTPQGNANAFGGTNYRFNNLSIDGAANNDVLGFQEPSSGAGGSVASGTPGGLAKTQPISLDAVQEVQVSIAPFDVRQGNFTGANLNAVTRSGTNTLEGSVYTFGRNQALTGRSVDADRSKIEDFSDYQLGFRLGVPIVKNKVFGFVNYELARRSEPVLGVPGTAGSNIPLEVAQAVQDTFSQRYQYDVGTLGITNIETVSDKFFARLDFNIGTRHQLAIRHNLVKASADNLERGTRIFKYGSQGFTHHSRTNSSVVELKSTLSNTVSNHLILGYNHVEDNRSYDSRVFPHVEIDYNTSNTLFAGTYREASIYGLTLRTTQITDHLNIYKNKHTLTLGTSNEFNHLEYRFLTAWNGRWEYGSVEDFFNNQPSRIRGVYHYTDNDFDFNRNNPSADFNVALLSIYAQDEYRVNPQLTLTVGIRADMQLHPDKVPLNPEVVNTPEFAHFDNEFGGVPQINPRIGFHYRLEENKKKQLRGGIGWFTGRIPFAWYAYTHYISGLTYGNIDIKPNGETFELIEDLSQLQSLQPGLTEINLVDNDFKLPRVLRTSLAYDTELANGLRMTLEGVFSKTLEGIQFKSINLREQVERYEGADNRYYYTASGSDKKINPNFTNVFLLTNTHKGYQYNLTASLQKEWNNNLRATAAYTYGESKDISNGVRNSMAANFNVNQAVYSNAPDLAYSNFDLRHRFIATMDFVKNWSDRQQTYISAVFNAQSGSPFSYIVSGDLDRDGSSRNDLVFIPSNSSEIQLQPILDEVGNISISADTQWQQLNDFIENDAYLRENRGGFAKRNGARTPWNYQVDLRLAHRIGFNNKNQQTLELTLDIFNFTNLIHRSWGLQYFVPNVSNASFQLLDLEGTEDNQPVYQFNNPNGTPWQIDPIKSRWQAQLGVRYSW